MRPYDGVIVLEELVPVLVPEEVLEEGLVVVALDGAGAGAGAALVAFAAAIAPVGSNGIAQQVSATRRNKRTDIAHSPGNSLPEERP